MKSSSDFYQSTLKFLEVFRLVIPSQEHLRGQADHYSVDLKPEEVLVAKNSLNTKKQQQKHTVSNNVPHTDTDHSDCSDLSVW